MMLLLLLGLLIRTQPSPSGKKWCQRHLPNVAEQQSMTQAEFEDNLARMLVEDTQPLATVERNGFSKFCAAVL